MTYNGTHSYWVKSSNWPVTMLIYWNHIFFNVNLESDIHCYINIWGRYKLEKYECKWHACKSENTWNLQRSMFSFLTHVWGVNSKTWFLGLKGLGWVIWLSNKGEKNMNCLFLCFKVSILPLRCLSMNHWPIKTWCNTCTYTTKINQFEDHHRKLNKGSQF